VPEKNHSLSEQEHNTKMAIKINIWNQKGGVGKTTAAITLGTGLAALGYKVVIVDTDPQGNVSTGLRGLLNSKGQPRDGLFNLLCNDIPLDDVLLTVEPSQYDFDLPAELPVIGPPGTLQVLPSYAKTTTAAIDLFLKGKSISTLRRVLQPLDEACHFILFDNPPSASLFTPAVLAMVDHILIVSLLARWSVDGIGEVYRIIADSIEEGVIEGADVMGIVPMMTELHTNEDKERLQELMTRYDKEKSLVWQDAYIPKSTTWKQASDSRKPIFKYATGEPASEAAFRLLNRFMQEVLNVYEIR
jgi:chromosome partitioning protein